MAAHLQCLEKDLLDSILPLLAVLASKAVHRACQPPGLQPVHHVHQIAPLSKATTVTFVGYEYICILYTWYIQYSDEYLVHKYVTLHMVYSMIYSYIYTCSL